MKQVIIDAVKKHAEGNIAKSKANVQVFLNNPVGVATHMDSVETVVKELKVMNLSDLVIALRPEVQPGESLNIKIVREGKEKMQGIGYLDDGTMVVIDEAKNFVGSRLDIVITGALQTPTGRMVFGKLINNPESNKSFKSPATQG